MYAGAALSVVNLFLGLVTISSLKTAIKKAIPGLHPEPGA